MVGIRGDSFLQMSANKYAPAYAYNYAYLTPTIRSSMIGAAHTFELPYVFGTLDKVPHAPLEIQPVDDQCQRINQALAEMKRKGVWSSYWFPSADPKSQEDQSISGQIHPELQGNLCKNWESQSWQRDRYGPDMRSRRCDERVQRSPTGGSPKPLQKPG